MKSAILVGLVSVAVVSGAAPTSSAVQPPRPKTLLTLPGSVVAFAQDADHIVWANGDAPCGRIVQLKSLSTGKTRFLDTPGGPLCEDLEDSFLDAIALAGKRALWVTADETFSKVYFTLFTAAPGVRAEQVLGDLAIELDDPLLRPVPMVGDGPTLLFAQIPTYAEAGDSFGRSGVYRVGRGRAQYVSGTEWALDVSTAGARFALARRIPGGCACNWQPEWSPDGSRIAFVSGRAEAERPQLFVMYADGSDVHVLVDDVTGFAWAPDGSLIAVANWRTGTLAIVRADGSAVRTLHADVSGGQQFAWSPDGRLLAYPVKVGDEFRLKVAPAGGGVAIDVGTLSSPFAWAPDSQHLAYARVRNGESRVYVVPVSGGVPLDLGAGDEPSWSPDGSSIVCRRTDGIYVVARDGSRSRRIVASSASSALGPVWSPDGAWIAFSRSQPGYEVWIVRPDGGSARRLASDGHSAVWSPRSDVIAFQASTGVALVDIDTGARRPIGPGSLPTWSFDGSRLAYVAAGEIEVVDTVGDRLARTSTKPAPMRMVVETRARDGRLLSTFDSAPRLGGLAFSGSRVALVIDQSDPRPEPIRGARARIEVRTTGGRLVRVVPVPRPVWGRVAMSGRWVVFRTWAGCSRNGCMQAVRVLDVLTGKSTMFARARVIIGLSIDGRRVAWAEQGAKGSRIRALMLPRD